MEKAAQAILNHVEAGILEFRRRKRLYQNLSYMALKNGEPFCEIAIPVE